MRCYSNKIHVKVAWKCGKEMVHSLLYRGVFIIFLLYLIPSTSAQTIKMREVFASMPDSVLPLVSKNNRLDCIDFIENNMEARVRNVFNEYVVLEALTDDYARFRSSSSSLLEMKLLPADSTFLLCVVQTALTGEVDSPRRLEDSNIRFLHPDWTPLPDSSAVAFTLPPLSDFIAADAPDSLRADYEQALRSLDYFHPVRLQLQADSATLTATLQPAYLAVSERKAVASFLRALSFRWNGRRFELN